ncbi:MAG: class I SAM-dependent methyltransferase [Bacteroidetes bacterium]|nr:class I SAM-dependent methyltransferase [Bacteroidota bacterium]
MKYCESYTSCKEERVLLFNKNGFDIKQCKKCGYRYTTLNKLENHLASVYSDDYFFKGQSGYPNYLEEKDILIRAGKKYAKIVGKYTKVGKVLDVGSAAGFILKGFEDMGWNCQGIEPNDTMASYGRNELNLNITTGGFEEFNSPNKFDLITLIEVIGSFYDLDKAMQNVVRLIKNDGMVLVESWDRKSLVARLFGKRWHEYCPPTVIHWYSDKTLSDLFSYYGFKLIAKGRPSKRININHGLSIFETNSPKFFMKKRLIGFFARKFGRKSMRYPPFDLKWYLFKKTS